MSVARLPILSASNPNRGVAIMADKGRTLFSGRPAAEPGRRRRVRCAAAPICASILLVNRSMAKVRKGKIPE